MPCGKVYRCSDALSAAKLPRFQGQTSVISWDVRQGTWLLRQYFNCIFSESALSVSTFFLFLFLFYIREQVAARKGHPLRINASTSTRSLPRLRLQGQGAHCTLNFLIPSFLTFSVAETARNAPGILLSHVVEVCMRRGFHFLLPPSCTLLLLVFFVLSVFLPRHLLAWLLSMK